jgi:TetR/AcrR family transcriptional regulator, lmrAB and yxaGH operons repressor
VTITTPTPTIDGPRERVVQAASRLLRTRGYAGTSLRDIVKAADAPWGSLQHYFPGGKDQIVVEAMRTGTSQVDGMIDDAFGRGRGAEAAVRAFFAQSAEVMEKRDFEAGCPVALVALEHAGGEDEIARLSRASLDGWIERFATYLREDGIESRAARRLGAAIINQYEGALMLSRIGRDVAPLRNAGNAMRQLVADAR